VEKIWTEGLILAQGKRWRRALHMQVERERLNGRLRPEGRAGKWRTGE